MDFNPAIPYNDLPPLPPKSEIETKAILKKVALAGRSLAELKGLGSSIPNQSILVNSLVLREAKASSEIENIITTNDALYKAFTAGSLDVDPATKEVLRYRAALWEGFTEMKKHGLLTTNLFIKLVQTINSQWKSIGIGRRTLLYGSVSYESLLTEKIISRISAVARVQTLSGLGIDLLLDF